MNDNDLVILPPSELEVMTAVWEAERAYPKPVLTSHLYRIVPALERLDISTVISLLNRLVGKGFLRIEKLGRNNTYESLVPQETYRTRAVLEFIDRICGGDRVQMFARIVESMTPEELAALRGLLEERKKA